MAEAQSAVSRFKRGAAAPVAAPAEPAAEEAPATPKRRGRPPKAVAEAVEGEAPKKRGRKPKAEEGPLPETLEATNEAIDGIEANIAELRKQFNASVKQLAHEHARLSKHRSVLMFSV